MAHALSIVAEAGFGGFAYESAINALRAGHVYRSTRCRWTLASSPEFTVPEFREYMAYAARAKFIDAGRDTDRIANGEYGTNSWNIRLTLDGWRQIEIFDLPLIQRWVANLRDNLPTVVISALVALVTSWLLFNFGPPTQ